MYKSDTDRLLGFIFWIVLGFAFAPVLMVLVVGFLFPVLLVLGFFAILGGFLWTTVKSVMPKTQKRSLTKE